MVKKQALVQISEKHLLNFMFLVSPNNKRFHSCLGTSVGQFFEEKCFDNEK